jgi:hypothetical protein
LIRTELIAMRQAFKKAIGYGRPGQEIQSRLAENCSLVRKNCAFDVTEAKELTLTWHRKKKSLF